LKLRYCTTDEPPEDAAGIVDAGLDRYNRSAAPVDGVRPLAAFAKADDDRLVGGAVGRTWGRCCELLQLWVEADSRRRGVGRELLARFEAHGRSRGCDVFYLTTLSFQAPEFYRKAGYRPLAEITGYPDGIAKYLMHKTED
jgi:ribosomal protein S18 acetylase RimI-like enzyme